MDEKALFLKIWDREAPAMRKVIARIPQEQSDYRADPKARTAREIAWLLVREEILLADGLEKGVLEWVDVPTPGSVEEILATYDRHHDDLTRRLHALPAAQWERRVPFMFRRQGNHERNRLRERLGLSPGCDSPSRAAVHLPAPDGVDRARRSTARAATSRRSRLRCHGSDRACRLPNDVSNGTADQRR